MNENKQERWADEWLGDSVGEASREEVLEALRSHVGKEVIIAYERLDGGLQQGVHGTLVEADRNPETWDTAETFAVIGPDDDAQVWHLDPRMREAMGLADVEPIAWLPPIPAGGIEQFLGSDAGAAGYRLDLGGGLRAALVLWQEALHQTESGDVAPGMGEVRGETNGES
jgi:hypothetical protein